MKKHSRDILQEFEAYLILDKDDLDKMVTQHSNLMHKVGKECARMTGEAVTKKAQLKKVHAKLSGSHRKRLEKIGRCTEKMIEYDVLLDEKHEKAFDLWNKTVVSADMMESLKDAFKTRGFMIRDMVAMTLSEYYSKDSFENSEQVKNYKADKMREKRRLR